MANTLTATDRPVEQRCTAQRSKGRGPCGNYAMQGQRVCRKHGGASPQALESARQYLASQAYSSVATLVKIRDDPDALAADRARCATAILDRSGYGPGQKVEIERTSDLRPGIIDMLNALPPPLSATALEAVSITTLPDIQGNTMQPNRKPSAQAQPK